jgi:tripartite-type tricarboxylate transporter receptor subunit TctC
MRRLLQTVATTFLVLCGAAHSQGSYPARPVTIVVPSSPGASSDLIARMIGQSITAQSKATVLVDDKPGANGILGVQAVMNAPADGHTLLFTTSSPVVYNKFLFKTLPYDPQTDLVPVGIMARGSMLLAVNPNTPFKTLQELVAQAKATPMKLNFGYSTATMQLVGELFQQASGAKITFVAYKTNTAMLQAVVTGEVDMAVSDPAGFLQYMKGGQIRVLATTAPGRLPDHPTISTFSEAGVPLKVDTFNGLFAKRGTAQEVLDRAAELMKTAHQSPELRAYLKTVSLDSFLVTGPEAVTYFEDESKRWKQLTHEAGVVPK